MTSIIEEYINMYYTIEEEKDVKELDWAYASDEEMEEMTNCHKKIETEMKDSDSGYDTIFEVKTEEKQVEELEWTNTTDEELEEMINYRPTKQTKEVKSDSGYSTTNEEEIEEELKQICSEPKWESKNLEKFLNFVERATVSMGYKLITQSMLDRKDFYSYHLIPHAVNAIVYNSYACGYNKYVLYKTVEDIVNIVKENKKVSNFISKYITDPSNYILNIIQKILQTGKYTFSKENIIKIIVKSLELIIDMINDITSIISLVFIEPVITVITTITTCMTNSIKKVFSWFN